MEKSCFPCQRITKCEVYVCAICAPETHDTVAQTNYKPMHQVGICQNYLAEDTNPRTRSSEALPGDSSSKVKESVVVSHETNQSTTVHKRK